MIALFLLCSCFFESVSGQSFELAWHSEIGLNKIPKNGCWCCWTIITQKAPVRANNQVGAVPITQSIWGKGGRWGTIIVVMVWTWRYDSDIRYCHWKTLSQRLPETICLSKNDISLYHKTRTTDSLLVCLLCKPNTFFTSSSLLTRELARNICLFAAPSLRQLALEILHRLQRRKFCLK